VRGALSFFPPGGGGGKCVILGAHLFVLLNVSQIGLDLASQGFEF
jgi:hypothetical protein